MCEIKQFPEVEKIDPQELAIKQLEENGSKVYKIELTCAELEFLRDLLSGVNEWMKHIEGEFHFNPPGQIEFERGFELIHPEELENKIFQQFYDEDGNYR